jgi:tetratricopeptide (TPR) repeat protein
MGLILSLQIFLRPYGTHWSAPEEETMTRPYLFPLAATVVTTVLLVMTGCGGGDNGDATTLDSVLTRTESLLDSGKDREARQTLRTHLLMQTDIRHGASAAAGFRMLADLYAASAFYDSAHVFYDKAADAYRGLAQRPHAYEMTITAGELDLRSGRPGRTRVLYEEALRLAVVFGDSASAQMLRLALVPVYAAVEDRSAENETLARLLAVARAHRDRADEARITVASGLASAGRGQHDDAASSFLRAVTLADGAGDSLLGTRALMFLGVSLDRAGQTREAIESFSMALGRSSILRYHTEISAELLVRVGNLYLRGKDTEQAARFFRATLKIAGERHDGLLEAYMMVQLGHAGLSADRAEALKKFRAAYDQFRSFGYAPGIAYALYSLGVIAEQENRLTDALQLYTAAVTEQEQCLSVREPGALFTECEHSAARFPGEDPSQALISLLLQLGRPDDAFAYQQRRNSRAFMMHLSAGEFRTGKRAEDSLLALCASQQALHRGAEWQQEWILSTAPSRMTVREDILSVLERSKVTLAECAEEIGRVAPAFLPLAEIRGERPADVQKRVPEGSALLTFIPGRRSMHIALVTPAGSTIRVSAQPPDKILRSIGDYMHVLRSQIAAGQDGSKPKAGPGLELQSLTRALYEALVLPVETLLKPGTRLFVLFPEGMQPFPVHALRRAAIPGTPWLIDRFTVLYLPSLRFPSADAHAASVPGSVTCLGFAGSSGWDVEYELRDVRFFFKDARMLFAREATFDSLRSVRSDVLHLAVDMRFGIRTPLFGSFPLSDGESPDGSRTVPLTSLVGLPPARIVLVAAISPEVPAFDPFVPLALGANGSGTIVMNAFLPSRGAKKAFGELFYTALLQGVSAEEAVRKAQQQMIAGKQFSTPASWGAFMVWGGR